MAFGVRKRESPHRHHHRTAFSAKGTAESVGLFVVQIFGIDHLGRRDWPSRPAGEVGRKGRGAEWAGRRGEASTDRCSGMLLGGFHL